MNSKEAAELLERYYLGDCSPEEISVIENWFESLPADDREMTAAERSKLSARLKQGIDLKTGHHEEPKRIKLWPRIAVAAAAVAAITLGVWVYNISNTQYMNGRHPEFSSGPPLANDIAPGKNGATITLANGKVIQLSDAKEGIVMDASEISYTDGTNISSSLRDEVKQSQLVMAATSRGQTYQVVLPDGSKVWLNADSKISFPSQFSGAERKVLLISGEAYFEVSKDKKHPFIVESNGQQVTVLGTHFNINSYADDGSTKTTLLEGSVKVSSLREGTTKQSHHAVLKPNQQSVLSGSNRITVHQVEVGDVIDWKEGYFMFNSQPLDQIMAKLARWYNVDIVFEDEAVKKETFFGKVSRYENITKALTLLESTGVVRFELKGNKVYVKRN